ncbi:MAG TPA: phospholipase D family protein, partial [Candidatus Saccharimonadales bacterium]|nr:phospholipase D family protein [Candidatus Saccharimonadales bacterium]
PRGMGTGPGGYSVQRQPALRARREDTLGPMSSTEQWLLSAMERGNTASAIDRRRGDGSGWTEANAVTPLIHGARYFARLHEELSCLAHGDQVWLCDWRGDASQRLAGPGTELGSVLAAAVQRGAEVRGLVWRSHPDEEGYAEQENAHLGQVVNDAGGQILADERVRRFGSHHQKVVVIQRGGRAGDVAFVGGIDLCHGRGDDERHEGDPQPIALDRRYGDRPAWHDLQLEIRGPAVGDLAETFRERWLDPTPLERQNWLSARVRRVGRQPQRPSPRPAMAPDPPPAGKVAVQVLRTYPAKRPPFPFAPRGERSVARAYAKALSRARSLIYVEDQYLWSTDVARFFADALRRSPELRLIAVVPRYPDRDGLVSGPLNRIGQMEALAMLHDAGDDRVAVYDLENEAGRAIYVHGKLCVIDDVWMAVGSDNLNRRSWTNDSEATCAALDSARDGRAPVDPGGLGDGARVLPRTLRSTLWREHLGPCVSEAELLDPRAGFEAWTRAAQALDGWHANGQSGPRPGGRARRHRPAAVPAWASWWARPLYRLAVDPDGRPADLKRSHTF